MGQVPLDSTDSISNLSAKTGPPDQTKLEPIKTVDGKLDLEPVLKYISEQLGPDFTIVSHKTSEPQIYGYNQARVILYVTFKNKVGKEIKLGFNYNKTIRRMKKEKWTQKNTSAV